MVVTEFFFDSEAIEHILLDSKDSNELLIFDYIIYLRLKLNKNARIINSSYAYLKVKNNINKILDREKNALAWGKLETFFNFDDFSSVEERQINGTSVIQEEKEYIKTLSQVFELWYVVKDISKFKDLLDKGIKILSLSTLNQIIDADEDFNMWLKEEFK